jgi:hypothetical protein
VLDAPLGYTGGMSEGQDNHGESTMNPILTNRLKVGAWMTAALFLGAFGVLYSVFTVLIAASSATAQNLATALARPAIIALIAVALLFFSWGSFRLARKHR